jgi:hypothetical protein
MDLCITAAEEQSSVLTELRLQVRGFLESCGLTSGAG